MINRVVEWSAGHPILIAALTVAAAAAGWWSLQTIPLDALPDLSETQVIIHCTWDRSPEIMESQVTYPIVTGMLGAPKVKDVRAVSDFGSSFIYVVFEDGTDLYWARSRTTEYLSRTLARLPAEVKVDLGPDATGLGWVFEYALTDAKGAHTLADLRSIQDWYLRFHLQSAPGVAEVASVGGFTRQYQIAVDPSKLQAYHVNLQTVRNAVRAGNADAGGRLLDLSGREYMVRSHGYVKSLQDLEQIAVDATAEGVPIRVADVATVSFGPDFRRGAADLNGEGETVFGIVVMRQGANALETIRQVKARLAEVAPGLPAGVKVVPVYDRSGLIESAVRNLKITLAEEMLAVSVVILIFLWHFPSAIIPILTIPIVALIAFVPMRLVGVSANVMSLSGIALAVGAMVDAAVVVVEQTHKKIEEWQRNGKRDDLRSVVLRGIQEVARPSFYSLLVIAVGFLPILVLQGQEGQLFRPLAFTKTCAMIAAALLAITLDPALRLLFIRGGVAAGNVRPEEQHPISGPLIRAYAPVVRWSLRRRWPIVAIVLGLFIVTIPIFFRLGSEFMPPLEEGALLFMPTTAPGIAIGEARRLMQAQDQLLMSFPEVERVAGKAGRAETATDPAPLSMLETVITLKPRQQWPALPTWYSGWPSFLKPALRLVTPDREDTDALVGRMDRALHMPGVSNAWTMPIRNRTEMQNTGIRTPVGVKVTGSDIRVIQGIAEQVESVLRHVPGTRNAFAERASDGYFVDIDYRRDQLARFGLTIGDAQAAVSSAIGGEDVTTIVDGVERYPVNVRYMSGYRSDVAAIERIAVPVRGGKGQTPLADIATVRLSEGPAMLRDDNGLLTSYVYADAAGRDLDGYVSEAKREVARKVKLPAGYALLWSGEFEAILRVRERLKLALPLTLVAIALLLYASTRSWAKTSLVLLAVPFSAIGAIWLLAFLGFNMSVSVWVGIIALMGVDAETGVFMLLYLDLACDARRRSGRLRDRNDLREAIVEGAAKRIRPKAMTVAAMLAGLLPMLWSSGVGAGVMSRIAAPLIGGILSSFLMELVVYPPLYEWWQWRRVMNRSA